MSGSQVMPLVSSSRPDVVLIDLRLPEVDGLACLEHIRAKHPTVRVVFFSAVDEHLQIARALEGGACAYLVKSIDPGDLVAVLRQALAGSFFCSAGSKPPPHVRTTTLPDSAAARRRSSPAWPEASRTERSRTNSGSQTKR